MRILPRGNWMDESGEVMKPALPHYLPQPKIEGRDLTRLDLAQWLVSRDNPLTARTVMNRLWKQFFGTGLSKTLDDLGAQGEPPANPALLDWLACEFMDSGWDMKHMVRTIVTSATYTASLDRDARNCWPPIPTTANSRGKAPFRIDAELVRDNALAISGLLVAEDRRAEREAVSARRLLGEPELSRARLCCRQGAKPISTRAVYLVAADIPASQPAGLRRAEPRRMLRRAQSLEHSAAGAGAVERSDIRRGGARLRRADSQRMQGTDRQSGSPGPGSERCNAVHGPKKSPR